MRLWKFTLLTLVLAAGCREIPENSLSFDDVSYVEDHLPPIHELTGDDTLRVPVLGINDFVLVNSLMIVSNKDNTGSVTVMSQDGSKILGKFLRTGRGRAR